FTQIDVDKCAIGRGSPQRVECVTGDRAAQRKSAVIEQGLRRQARHQGRVDEVIGTILTDFVVRLSVAHADGDFTCCVLRIALETRPGHAPLFHDAANDVTASIMAYSGNEQRIVPQRLEVPGDIEWRPPRYPGSVLEAIEQHFPEYSHMQILDHDSIIPVRSCPLMSPAAGKHA